MLSTPSPDREDPDPRALVTGSKVYLRYPVAEDEREFVALRAASRALHEPWEATPQGVEPGYDPFGASGFHRTLASANTPHSQRHLICRVSDHAIVGQASLGGIQRGPLQQAFVGYWCGQGFLRCGYTLEGVGLAITRAFKDLGLHRVEINIVPQNAASLALAARLGVRREGFSPRYLQIAGRWQDHERWAVTADEWDFRTHKVLASQ